MWQSRMFWQLFGTYGVLILVALGLLGLIVGSQVERSGLADIEESLRNKALLLQEIIRGRDIEQDEVARQRVTDVARRLALRVTLISRDGKVLAESWRPDSTELENHADRPEVFQARETGFGKAVRHSSTLGQDMMYAAKRTDLPDSQVGFIRVALPLAGVQGKVEGMRRLVWSATGLTALLALVLAFWLARRTTRPIRHLTRGAEKIAAGDHGYRVHVERGDECGQLARAFNHMSERLAAQFGRLDDDRQQLRTVLSSMVEGVVAIDHEQKVLFANERAAQLLDFSSTGAVGRFLWEVVRHRSLHDVIGPAMADGERQAHELLWTGPQERSLSVHVARLPGAPARGAVLVFHDNTELRRLETLRQEFVANVSHELKTPLAIIQACVETLIDGAVDDPLHRGKFLERIADQATRLHALIIDLLRLARIESETEAFSREELELDGIIHECLDKHRTLADGKRHRLEVLPPPPDQAPALAWADEEAVRQIIDNLLDNAIKYTPEGGSVHVRWGRDGDKVLFEIKDTGIGIPPAELPRIFERFYRVDRARSRALGGTGLGLSIVKHLAQAMHGSVRATSQVGTGSTFTVVLPAAAP